MSHLAHHCCLAGKGGLQLLGKKGEAGSTVKSDSLALRGATSLQDGHLSHTLGDAHSPSPSKIQEVGTSLIPGRDW